MASTAPDPGAQSLRSNLVYLCGGELQNLTVSDLEEVKWPQKRLVFRILMSMAPSLQMLHEEICTLQDGRDREVKRMANLSREERLEAEKIYRSRFFQIIVKALEKLRFPPTLQPFADITTDLYHDPTLVRSAMAWLMSVGLPEGAQSPSRFAQDTSRLPPPAKTPPSASRPRSSGGSGSGSGVGVPPRPSSPSPMTENARSADITPVVVSPRHTHAYPTMDESVSAPSFSTSVGGDGEFMSRLQRQNEFLSQQLRRLMASEARREQSEMRMENVMRELSRALGELACTGADTKGKGPSKDKDDVSPATLSREEDARFLTEVTRKEQAARNPLGENDSSSGSSGTSPSPRKAATTTTTTKRAGTLISKEQRVKWTAVRSSVDALLQQWVAARRDQRQVGASRVEDGAAASLMVAVHGAGARSSSQGMILRDVLSLGPPLAGADAALSTDEGGQGMGLDLPRVHALQRDLVDVSESAFALATALTASGIPGLSLELSNGSKSGGSHSGGDGTSGRSSDPHAELERLTARAQTLLLHTSALAPVAPLVSAPSLSSSCAGIDALAASLQHGGLACEPRVQRALDRTRVEQSNMARCLSLTRRVLAAWPEAAQRTRQRLARVGDQAKAAAKVQSARLARFSEGTEALRAALVAVQSDRSSATALGQLAKGAMGPHVAALVHALEVYGSDFEEMPGALMEARREISAAFEKDVEEAGLTAEALRVAQERSQQLCDEGDAGKGGVALSSRDPCPPKDRTKDKRRPRRAGERPEWQD